MMHIPIHNRLHLPTRHGINSVFGRIIRDERLAALLIAGLLILLVAFAVWIGSIRI